MYFPKIPYCQFLDANMKTQFDQSVDRLSAKTQTMGLLDQSPYIIINMKHQYRLSKFYKKFQIFELMVKHFPLWQHLSFYICIIQNVIILLVLEDDHQFTFGLKSREQSSTSESNFIIDTPQTDQVIEILSNILQYLQIAEIVVCCILFVVLFIKQVPFLYEISKYKIKEQKMDGWKLIKINLFKLYIYFTNIMLNGFFLYYFLYFICAILGLFNPLFSALLLLDLFRRFPILLSILESLYRPRKQIILTLLLLFLFTYYFALIYYYNFYSNVDPICHSLWVCLTYMVDRTYKVTGGIASENLDKQYDDEWSIGMLNLYQFFYIFIILTLMSQIISGIIIDTFAKLRDEQADIKKDKESICFICGENLNILDRFEGGFFQHINEIHSPWNYIFYISYLKDKKQTELSGFQSHVLELIEKRDNSWFPIQNTGLNCFGIDHAQILEENLNTHNIIQFKSFDMLKEQMDRFESQMNQTNNDIIILKKGLSELAFQKLNQGFEEMIY